MFCLRVNSNKISITYPKKEVEKFLTKIAKFYK